MHNQGFGRNETGEKIRISGLLRLEVDLEVLLVCLLTMRSTQDPILLTFNFGSSFLLALTSFRALSLSLWCHLSIPYACAHTTVHLTSARVFAWMQFKLSAFTAVQTAMCVFTYDCFPTY